MGYLSSIPGLGRSPGEGNCYLPGILAWRTPWSEGVSESVCVCVCVSGFGVIICNPGKESGISVDLLK